LPLHRIIASWGSGFGFGMRATSRRSFLLPVLIALVVLAWVTLWVWEDSPHARYMHHGGMGHMGTTGGLGAALGVATVYVAGWTLMTVAMMLPTSLPLVEIFRRLTSRRKDHLLLVALLIIGYLSVWALFGAIAHVFDWSVHHLARKSHWLSANSWSIGGGLVLVAGAFQFTRLKYRCLDKCRTPLTFVMRYWRNRQHRRNSLLLGMHHGLFCIGCCWALMMLMFAVGSGSVGWMFALGAVMALEKNVSWGRKLSAPLGVILLTWGVAIFLSHI